MSHRPQEVSPEVVVVTPSYEDNESVQQLWGELLMATAKRIQLVVVDDGSVHSPVALSEIESTSPHACIIRLKRNVGHQRAIAVGLHYATTHFPTASVVVMDADGEDPPHAIESLLEPLTSINVDICVAKRQKRHESFGFRTFYFIYRMAFRLLTGRRLQYGNFLAASPLATRRLCAMSEITIHLPAAIIASRLSRAEIPVDRGTRYFGESKMNFVSLATHGFRSLVVFVEDVLIRVGILFTVGTFCCLALVLTASILKIFGMATPGWLTTVMGISILSFILLGFFSLLTLLLSSIIKQSSILPIDFHALIDKIDQTSNFETKDALDHSLDEA